MKLGYQRIVCFGFNAASDALSITHGLHEILKNPGGVSPDCLRSLASEPAACADGTKADPSAEKLNRKGCVSPMDTETSVPSIDAGSKTASSVHDARID